MWCSYIGKTSRHLFTRISEPLERSSRTNNILLNPPISAIINHSIKLDHFIKFDNFKIINSATIYFKISIKESISIKKMSPSLSDNNSFKLMFCTKIVTLNVILLLVFLYVFVLYNLIKHCNVFQFWFFIKIFLLKMSYNFHAFSRQNSSFICTVYN